MDPMWKPARSVAFRCILGSVFTIAGITKIADPIGFFSTLMAFRLFHDLYLPLLTIILPWLELILGLMLLMGLMVRASALLLIILNILFSFFILSVVIRGMEIDCGCFGMLSNLLHIPDQADLKAVIRDLIFAAMSLDLYHNKRTMFSLENYIRKRK